MFKHLNQVLIIPCVLMTSLLLFGCSKSTESEETIKSDYHQSANIETIQPETTYQVSRQYIGKVISKQNSAIGFEYSGKIQKIYVDNGDIVTKGQLLAELNTELPLISLQEIDARIHQLHAQARLNKLNLNRINELSTKGYSSQQTLDELETEKTVIADDLSRQQANKATVAYQIAKAKLYAPFNAIISNRAIATGEVFSPNQTAFELIKKAHHEVSVGVPIKVASKLEIGQTIAVEIENKSYQATLLVIGKQVNTVTRTVELRFSLSNQATFYNEQLAKININQNIDESGFWLPLSALTDGIRGQWNIYTVEPSSNELFVIKAMTVDVKYSTDEFAYVSGLTLTPQHVITTGVHRYVPGQLVKKFSKSKANNKGNAP